MGGVFSTSAASKVRADDAPSARDAVRCPPAQPVPVAEPVAEPRPVPESRDETADAPVSTPENERTLYDALVVHLAASVRAAMIVQATRNRRPSFAVATITSMVEQTTYVPSGEITAVTATIVELLVAEPGIALHPSRKYFVLDATKLTPDTGAAGASTDASDAMSALVRRLAQEIALKPVTHAAIGKHAKNALAHCAGLSNTQARRVVVQHLRRLGCIASATDGSPCLAINAARLQDPAASFPDLTFLLSLPSMPRRCRSAARAPRSDASEAVVHVTRSSDDAGRSLYDALLEHLIVHLHGAVHKAIQAKKKQFKLHKLSKILTKAGYVDDVPSTSAYILRRLLADPSLRRGGALNELLVAASPNNPPPLPRTPETTIDTSVSALVEHYGRKIAIAPQATMNLVGELHARCGDPETAQTVLDTLRATGCVIDVLATTTKQTPSLGINPALVRQPLASFQHMSFLRSVASVPALATACVRTDAPDGAHVASDDVLQHVAVELATLPPRPDARAPVPTPPSPPTVQEPRRPDVDGSNDVASVVRRFEAAYLDAIVAWVQNGDVFYVSYIRSQVRPLMSPDMPMDAAIMAIVSWLTQHPQLVFCPSDRPCFVGSGFPPPDDRVDLTPPRSTTTMDDDDVSLADSDEDGASEPETEEAAVSSPLRTKAWSGASARRVIAGYVHEVVANIAVGDVYNSARLEQELGLLALDDVDLADAVDAVASTLQTMPHIIDSSTSGNNDDWTFRKAILRRGATTKKPTTSAKQTTRMAPWYKK
ncbi:hypothetical protein SPRG_13055 [Saprolegnia parasitica CBS 223.65]|uniref:Uncharacterized protein n=1 Tax=Saprolegnia parasitica (strain CBS 223.65) TaxID=695850 RepID=A0A067BN68_SAPPC|nr:hypothetical protein SPRG_13055 [Saprolegnia parasitica CBS 223.65]KDO19949.1 hypothetical protein SPRG_13055 [Saprolegnia parasitica CBS 223.65]|eukprot:XP_012209321.1 hypothetical protein SPRG_13055 [Saprolegnia parasitica CBS 223.65]